MNHHQFIRIHIIHTMSQCAEGTVFRVIIRHCADALDAVPNPCANLVGLRGIAQNRCNLHLLLPAVSLQTQTNRFPLALLNGFHKCFLILLLLAVCLQNAVSGFQKSLAGFMAFVIRSDYAACFQNQKPFCIHRYAHCSTDRNQLPPLQRLCRLWHA